MATKLEFNFQFWFWPYCRHQHVFSLKLRSLSSADDNTFDCLQNYSDYSSREMKWNEILCNLCKWFKSILQWMQRSHCRIDSLNPLPVAAMQHVCFVWYVDEATASSYTWWCNVHYPTLSVSVSVVYWSLSINDCINPNLLLLWVTFVFWHIKWKLVTAENVPPANSNSTTKQIHN